jgi:hypothetical protein
MVCLQVIGGDSIVAAGALRPAAAVPVSISNPPWSITGRIARLADARADGGPV